MKIINRLIALTGAAAALTLTVGSANAQNQAQPGQGQGQGQGGRTRGGQPGGQGGNFDPAQFRERMMQSMRDRLEVKDDEEWKLISERITKVTEAQRGVRTGGAGFTGGRTGGGGPPGGGGGGTPGGDNNGGGGRTRGGGGAGGPPGFTREPDPEADALQKAIEAKAPADEIKAKLARLRDAHKEKEGKLDKAQEDLRQVLSARQEAQAVLMGLLK